MCVEAWGAELKPTEEGTVVVESVFAMLFLLTLLLATVQVVFTVYARNVVQAGAHEGVRSAIERGAKGGAATAAVRATVVRAAGGLLTDVGVEVEHSPGRDGDLVAVQVEGRLRPIGPLPFRFPVTATAHGMAAEDPR